MVPDSCTVAAWMRGVTFKIAAAPLSLSLSGARGARTAPQSCTWKMVCPLSLRVGVCARARVCRCHLAAPHHLLLQGKLVADTTTWFSCLDYNYPLCTLTDGFIRYTLLLPRWAHFCLRNYLLSGMGSRRKHFHLYWHVSIRQLRWFVGCTSMMPVSFPYIPKVL